MRKNDVYSGRDYKERLLSGIEKVAKSVTSTLGAKGRTVIIEKDFQTPHITKDGVTVAKAINLKDPIENIGARLITQASEHTNKEAGDGTTTSTLLAYGIIKEAQKYIASGADANAIRRGMEKTLGYIVDTIKGDSTKIENREDVFNIAMVSSNGDKEISDIVADCFMKVGASGIVSVDNATYNETTLEIQEGYSVDRGYMSHHFANNADKTECVLEDSYVFVLEGSFELNAVAPILDQVSRSAKPLVMFVDTLPPEILKVFVENKLNGAITVNLVQNDGIGQEKVDIREDIATLTGTQVYSQRAGHKLQDLKLVNLGRAKKVVSQRESTKIFIHDSVPTEKINERVALIQEFINTTNNVAEKKKAEKRVAKIKDGIAVIYVGAHTDTELKEKKDRVDDCVSAVRASLQEGVVIGGGVELLKVSRDIKYTHIDMSGDEELGKKILQDVLRMPFLKIMENGGKNGEVCASQVDLHSYHGVFDIRENKLVLLDHGCNIFDPTKVVRLAVINAVYTAGVIITSEYCIGMEEQKMDPSMFGGLDLG